MQNNFNPPAYRPPQAPHNGVYVIDPDQLALFPIPPEKPEITPFQRLYGPKSQIRKATKNPNKFKKTS